MTRRVMPLTSEDLHLDPPPQVRLRVPVANSVLELLRSRTLLLTFVERDLRVRYKQAALGGLWAVLQPLMLMVIFTVVFGRIAKVGSDGLPYAVFAYTALAPWQLFSNSVSYGTTSVLSNAPIVRKIYMPREIFPLSAYLAAAVDLGVTCLVLVGMLFAFGYWPTVQWVVVPLLILILSCYAVAASLVFSGLIVRYRDLRYATPMLLQVLLYATPIAYPLSRLTGPNGILHGWVRVAYPYLNPFAPIVDGFRRALALGLWPQWGPLASAAGLGVVLVACSYRWYKRADRNFADVI